MAQTSKFTQRMQASGTLNRLYFYSLTNCIAQSIFEQFASFVCGKHDSNNEPYNNSRFYDEEGGIRIRKNDDLLVGEFADYLSKVS